MKKIIERIVKSSGSPDTNDLWLDENLSLKVYDNEEWRSVAGGSDSGSGSGEGKGSDVQIVELNFEDPIPKTGTLSASDLAKLDGDNCLLIINGKYFRKTFSSDGGIDYKEIGLTTVLGGVRSIYFTASKPDGEYTIAYTYPVEANVQTSDNLPELENIKVGNTTYAIPQVSTSGGGSRVMIVDGTIAEDDGSYIFTPNDSSIKAVDAVDFIFSGGNVIGRITTVTKIELFTFTSVNLRSTNVVLLSLYFYDMKDIVWFGPNSSGGDPAI